MATLPYTRLLGLLSDGGLLGALAADEQSTAGHIEGYLALASTLLALLVFIGLAMAQRR